MGLKLVEINYPLEGIPVSQQNPDKNEAAKERTEDTRRFVRQVRAATRRKYTSEEKIRIVLEGLLHRRSLQANDCQVRGGGIGTKS